MGKYARITAIITAGKVFATLILSFHKRLTPTQKINTEPTSERLSSAWADRIGPIKYPSKVNAL